VTDLTNNRVCPSQGRPKRTNMSWYARMSEENKAEYLQRQRIAHQQKIDAARSGLDGSQPPATYIPSSPHTPMSNVTQTPCCESAMGHVSTSANFHGQESFVAKSADPHKRRHQRREKYSLMTDEQREEYLRNNRKYKHCRRESGTLFDHNDTIHVKNSSASSPRTNAAMHAQSSEQGIVAVLMFMSIPVSSLHVLLYNGINIQNIFCISFIYCVCKLLFINCYAI
jgi:hypothetical protein